MFKRIFSRAKNVMLAPVVNSYLGSLIIITAAIFAFINIYDNSYIAWLGLSDNNSNHNSLLNWLRREDVQEVKPDYQRLDMGVYQGYPNINKNITSYDTILKRITAEYDVDCTLTKAIMYAESRGKAKARSNRGAMGLMQLMPMTAKAMGVNGNLYDPEKSILAGVRYIKLLMKTACYEKTSNEVCDVSKDYKYMIASYNGGSRANLPGDGACAKMPRWECKLYDGYFETRVYVNRVKANYDVMIDNDWGC